MLSEPVGVDAVEPAVMFALQAEGVQVVDGQQLMQQARMIKTEDEITLLNTACMMVDAAYEQLYRAMRPGFRENDCVALVNKVLYEMGSEFVEGVNAISGERCSPHPHVYTDRALRPGDPAYFDILHSFNGYRTCYYRTFAVGSASTGAGRRLQTLPLLPRRRHQPDPARRHHRRSRRSLAQSPRLRIPQRRSRLRAPIRARRRAGHLGETDHQPPRLARPPRGDPGGHGLRPGNLLARHRRLVSAARIEEQLVVTNTGCEIITRFPAEDLLIAGKPYYTVGGTLPLERETESNLNTQLDPATQEAIPGNGRPAADTGAATLR